MITHCERGDDELSRSRHPVLTCGERVEACFAHAAEVAGAGAACERIETSCAAFERPMVAQRAAR
jgi:hypothetical protein